MFWAYCVIAGLTVVLVIVNVRSAVDEYRKHHLALRLACQMIALLLAGAMLITVSYFVIDRSMDAAVSRSAASRRPLNTNVAPSRPNAIAAARPIPDPAPVTHAILLLS